MVVAITLMAALRTQEKRQETAPAWEYGNGTTLRVGMHSGGWQDGRLVEKKKKRKTVHKPKHAWLATTIAVVSLPYHSLYTANPRANV